MEAGALFDLKSVHPSWQEGLKKGLAQMDPQYLKQLYEDKNWLPGAGKIFNAFSLPIDQVNYVLFGESPYPRLNSANGYAFWDAAVTDLWSPTGLSKAVNRATSLRNMIKMFLVAEDVLSPNDTGQEAIANIDKQPYVKTNNALFNQFGQQGFLLLNASLVLQTGPVSKDARAWQLFMKPVLEFLFQQRPTVELILFGNIAIKINQLIADIKVKKIQVEHPYNISFIQNPEVLAFFKPLHLLRGQ